MEEYDLVKYKLHNQKYSVLKEITVVTKKSIWTNSVHTNMKLQTKEKIKLQIKLLFFMTAVTKF